MAENIKPNYFMDPSGDDDDDEDLFISAIESNLKSTSLLNNDSTKSGNVNEVETSVDNIFSLVNQEINLKDEEETNKDEIREKNPLVESKNFLDSNFEECSVNPNKKENDDDVKAEIPASVTNVLKTKSVVTSTSLKNVEQEAETNLESSNDHFIQIRVGDPQKIGERISSFICFKVSTRTNLPFFRKQNLSVNRRFSDFLGLRDKLAEKHVHLGHIVPPAPVKDAMGTAKVIMSKEEVSSFSEFLEKRAASLERFLNRISMHPVLQSDPDFREFLELETELPKAKNTSALSGAGVRRWLNRFGDTVNKMTFRMDETDPWFEEKQNQIENLDQQLRKLHASIEALIHHTKELSTTTGAFAKSAAMLGNCEEHTALSCALSQLADTEEKIESLYNEQANNDFYHLSELLRDYVALIGVVKDVFHQRVKVYQTWQHAQQMLNKKKENKVRLELSGKSDRFSQANDEVVEWEAKVSRGQEKFELISKNIKKEVEAFEINRVKDFKISIIKYMESLLNTQQHLIKYWERFFPEAKAIA